MTKGNGNLEISRTIKTHKVDIFLMYKCKTTTAAYKLVIFYYLFIVDERSDRFMPFLRILTQSEMPATLSRI